MRSWGVALGLYRSDNMSRNAVRWCDVSAASASVAGGCVGVESSGLALEAEESFEVTGRRSTRLEMVLVTGLQDWGRKWLRWTYHNGHVPDTFNSHGSTHSGWNLWSQGRTRRSWPFSKSSVQMEQPSVSSWEEVSVPAAAADVAAG